MCNLKTMLKVGAAMLAIAGIAYVVFPGFQGWIVAALPTLAFLICPISMLLCMKMMRGQNGQSCSTANIGTDNKSQSALSDNSIKNKQA